MISAGRNHTLLPIGDLEAGMSTDPNVTASGERHPEPRLDLVAHVREKLAQGRYGGDAQLRVVARRLAEKLAERKR